MTFATLSPGLFSPTCILSSLPAILASLIPAAPGFGRRTAQEGSAVERNGFVGHPSLVRKHAPWKPPGGVNVKNTKSYNPRRCGCHGANKLGRELGGSNRCNRLRLFRSLLNTALMQFCCEVLFKVTQTPDCDGLFEVLIFVSNSHN